MPLSILNILLILVLTGPGCRTESMISETSPAVTPPAEESAPADVAPGRDPVARHPDPEIDALLVRIEDRGRTIDGLAGTIIYRKDEALLNRHETRTGTFTYEARDEAEPERLAVLFDQLVVNKVRRQRQREYLFDGTWLTEIDHDRRTIIRRQLAPEGETIDTVGTGGPIPLLTGHTRADLLRRYEITAYDPGDHSWTGTDEPVHGLRMQPRAGTPQAKEIASIDVVFNEKTLVPMTIVETGDNGDQKLVRLTEVTVNPVLDEATKRKLASGIPDPLPEGWKVHVEPLVTTAPGEAG